MDHIASGGGFAPAETVAGYCLLAAAAFLVTVTRWIRCPPSAAPEPPRAPPNPRHQPDDSGYARDDVALDSVEKPSARTKALLMIASQERTLALLDAAKGEFGGTEYEARWRTMAGKVRGAPLHRLPCRCISDIGPNTTSNYLRSVKLLNDNLVTSDIKRRSVDALARASPIPPPSECRAAMPGEDARVGLHYYETKNDSVLRRAREVAEVAVKANARNYKQAAADIVAAMEASHGGVWNCCVGTEYGCFVHYEPDAYMTFDAGGAVMVTLYSPP